MPLCSKGEAIFHDLYEEFRDNCMKEYPSSITFSENDFERWFLTLIAFETGCSKQELFERIEDIK